MGGGQSARGGARENGKVYDTLALPCGTSRLL